LFGSHFIISALYTNFFPYHSSIYPKPDKFFSFSYGADGIECYNGANVVYGEAKYMPTTADYFYCYTKITNDLNSTVVAPIVTINDYYKSDIEPTQNLTQYTSRCLFFNRSGFVTQISPNETIECLIIFSAGKIGPHETNIMFQLSTFDYKSTYVYQSNYFKYDNLSQQDYSKRENERISAYILLIPAAATLSFVGIKNLMDIWNYNKNGKIDKRKTSESFNKR